MKKKVLLTGGSGLLATNWFFSVEKEFDVVLGLHERNISIQEPRAVVINMETSDAFAECLRTFKPDFVIHCAGLANVEFCEANPAIAYHVNVAISENVAIACKENGIQLAYICTDHIFSGNKPLVTESEPVSPVNVYGKTKLDGESAVLSVSKNFLSIRTNFYGWGPKYRRSFSDMIIDNLTKGEQVSLFEDFYYTPILTEELAETVMSLLEVKASGIFNVVGDERISKLDFGLRLAKRFALDTQLIKTSFFSERKDLVKRPQDLSLSNEKVSKLLNKQIGNINAGIEKLYQQKENGFADMIKSI